MDKKWAIDEILSSEEKDADTAVDCAKEKRRNKQGIQTTLHTNQVNVSQELVL